VCLVLTEFSTCFIFTFSLIYKGGTAALISKHPSARDDKLDTDSQRIDATLTRAGTGIDRLVGDATQRLRELRKTE